MGDRSKRLNVQYSLINVLYLALICGTMGFAANYLLDQGMANAMVGVILTTVSVLNACIQAFSAPIVDKSEVINEKKFIMASLLIGAISCAVLLFGGKTLLIPAVILTFAAASVGMPFLNSVAFLYEKEGIEINYGVSRGLGSAAYAVAGWAFGKFLVDHSPSTLPWAYLLFFALTFFAVFTLPEPKAENEESEEVKKAESISYGEFFRKYRKLTTVVLGMVLIYFCHFMINNFMINVVTAIAGADGASGYQGTAVFIQAMVELPAMFLFAQLLKKFGVNQLMGFAAVMYALKHIVVLISVFSRSVPMYYGAMVLQGLSYAVIVPAAVYFANEMVEKADLNKGQSVVALSSTVGGLFASLVGGSLFDLMSVGGVLVIGVIATIAGAVLIFITTRR